MPQISVIIRALNEEKYLGELLSAVARQKTGSLGVETVLVDSGSTDRTQEIAKSHGTRITTISKEDFSFGRSLNIGCDFAWGKFLVFISGHCIPCDDDWLIRLVQPLMDGCVYTYGRQLGRDTTKFSEQQLFDKYFPATSRIPQEGFFCNNANAAMRKDAWTKNHFDEELTGCEDMALAKLLVEQGHKVGYVADAGVFHIHDETWQQVKRRYEREAIALRSILPEVQLTRFDLIRFITTAILKDSKAAFKKGILMREIHGIIRFRTSQYGGAFKGNREIRRLSQEMKTKYFYPLITDMDIRN